MKTSVLEPGEVIHVLHRFEKDIRRHFVGEVECVQDGVARVAGHVFVVDDPKTHQFVKRPDRRVKLVPLQDGELIINVLPSSVALDQVRYEDRDHRLHLTDGTGWSMDLKEFGWN
jgi:hypothetical protein